MEWWFLASASIEKRNFNYQSRMNGSPEDNNSKPYSQGVRPKVKQYVCSKRNKATEIGNDSQKSKNKSEKANNIQNGASSSCQNGASCSYQKSASCSSSSSSSSLNKLSSDSCEKNNTDFLAEKFVVKNRTLLSEDKDLETHDVEKKSGGFVHDDNSSGNEGDEGLSGDDFCIYTYKGDQFADLPNSFFPVDMVSETDQLPYENHHGVVQRRQFHLNENERNSAGSSPEMDYLEMDFDPGPSLEQDSEEDFDGFDRKLDNISPVPELPCEKMIVDNHMEGVLNGRFNQTSSLHADSREPCPGTSKDISVFQCSTSYNKVSDCNSNSLNRTKEILDSDCCVNFCSVEGSGQNGGLPSQSVKEEAKSKSGRDISFYNCQLYSGKRLDRKFAVTEKGKLCEDREDCTDVSSKSPLDGIMLWTEQEAIAKQVTLVSPEISCGASAVVNVMLVLKMRISTEKVKEGISSGLKSESSSIPQYLVSRSFAGVGHENLIRGIHHASQGTLFARFFQMYPKPDIILSQWLSHWMKKGAVPIATTNMRDSNPEEPILDTRHHQMIFGVSSKGIFLTNPLECLQDEELWRRLNSPSVLKIKRSEIVSRWSPGTDLKPLMFQSDERWKKMNVLGQVVNIIRESPDPDAQGKFFTQHISIPASAGIILVIPRESSAYDELVSMPDIPLFFPSKSE